MYVLTLFALRTRNPVQAGTASGWLAGCILLALLGNVSGARADIYAFVDKNGVQHFSNRKIEPNSRTVVYGSKDSYVPLTEVAAGGPGATYKPRPMRALSQHPNLIKFEPLLVQAAKDYAVEVELLKAVMAAESGFNPLAVSHKGAVGLMQLMPATAARYGLRADSQKTISQKLTDPETNIRLGARYLRDLQALFPSRQELMIASYNAGEGAVQKYKNQIPPYPETRNYVQQVTQFYQFFKPRT